MRQTALCNLSKWHPLKDGAQGIANLTHPKAGTELSHSWVQSLEFDPLVPQAQIDKLFRFLIDYGYFIKK